MIYGFGNMTKSINENYLFKVRSLLVERATNHTHCRAGTPIERVRLSHNIKRRWIDGHGARGTLGLQGAVFDCLSLIYQVDLVHRLALFLKEQLAAA